MIEKFDGKESELIESAYLRCLARFPTATERDSLLRELAAADSSERRIVMEDLFWSLMTSREFLYNH
jgi:hypothetical protein